MHVSLTEKLEDYVKSKVASGLYNNASEVVREALRMKIAAEESDEARLERLRAAVNLGWEQAERGELVEFDLQAVLARLDRETPADA